MQTYTTPSVVLRTAILTAGLCLAFVLAGVSVGNQAPSTSVAHNPVSFAAQSIAAVEVNSRGPSAGGNVDADGDFEGYGAAIPADLSIARVYFQ